MVAILPDTIPDDAAPLTGTEDLNAEQIVDFNKFMSLAGRNVFVDLKDGNVYVGLLHSTRGSEFQVGTKSGVISYRDVVRFRQV